MASQRQAQAQRTSATSHSPGPNERHAAFPLVLQALVDDLYSPTRPRALVSVVTEADFDAEPVRLPNGAPAPLQLREFDTLRLVVDGVTVEVGLSCRIVTGEGYRYLRPSFGREVETAGEEVRPEAPLDVSTVPDESGEETEEDPGRLTAETLNLMDPRDEETVAFDALERVLDWLRSNRPPSPALDPRLRRGARGAPTPRPRIGEGSSGRVRRRSEEEEKVPDEPPPQRRRTVERVANRSDRFARRVLGRGRDPPQEGLDACPPKSSERRRRREDGDEGEERPRSRQRT